MYSSLLRLALIVLLCLFVAPLVAQDVDPFGEVVEKPKKEKVLEDPFGGPDPIPAKQEKEKGKEEVEENPFGPATEKPAKTETKQESENPFGPANVDQEKAVPTQADQKQQIEDPFSIQDPTKRALPTESTQPMKTDATQNQDELSGGGGEKNLTNDRGEKAEESHDLPAEKTFEEKFWDYLKSNAYENWAPAPGQSAGHYVGESPHGAFLKMYLNRTAVGDPTGLPNGSIIVKENYAVDRETLKAITVMYRSKDYNPEGGNWYWIKYNPDGSVATTSTETGSEKIMGRAKGCINCHGGADGGDFTFFNDN